MFKIFIRFKKKTNPLIRLYLGVVLELTYYKLHLLFLQIIELDYHF